MLKTLNNLPHGFKQARWPNLDEDHDTNEVQNLTGTLGLQAAAVIFVAVVITSFYEI